MKRRSHKFMAMLLAAVMMTASCSTAFAEEPAPLAETAPPQETSAPETQQPETKAPETQAPETQQPETSAPETQQPETAAPETQQPETKAPETQAPETQTPASENQPPATEKQTQASEAQASEKKNESNKEETTVTFTAKAGKATVKITLPKDKAVSKDASLSASVSKFSDDKDSRKKAQSALEKGYRTVAGGRLFTITLKKGDEKIRIPKGTKIEVTKDDGIPVGLSAFAQGKAEVLDMTGKNPSVLSANTVMSGDGLQVKSVSFTAACDSFAIVGTENRQNTGDKISLGALRSELKGIGEKEIITGSDALLNDLANYSMKLANGQSGDGVVVVNVYTNGTGKLQTNAQDPQDPMKQVLRGDKIDVTDRGVVINVVTKGEAVTIPHYGVVVMKGGAEEKVNGGNNTPLAGRVIFNIVTIQTGTEGNYVLAPYGGTVTVDGNGIGNYFAPRAQSISVSGNLTGGAYAAAVKVDGNLNPATVTAELPKETEKETEKKNKKETESESETTAQTEQPKIEEKQTGKETEQTETDAKQTESEAKQTETETKQTESKLTPAPASSGRGAALNEMETEAETETEKETETETESETEPATETESEPASVTETEEQLSEVAAEESLVQRAMYGPTIDYGFLPAKTIKGDTTTLNNSDVHVVVQDGSSPPLLLKGAKLALYNTSQIPKNDPTVPANNYFADTSKFSTTGIPADTLLATWDSEDTAGYAEVISNYILRGQSYVIKEIQVPAGTGPNTYFKAPDVRFTCNPDGTITSTGPITYSSNVYLVDIRNVPLQTIQRVLWLGIKNDQTSTTAETKFVSGLTVSFEEYNGTSWVPMKDGDVASSGDGYCVVELSDVIVTKPGGHYRVVLNDPRVGTTERYQPVGTTLPEAIEFDVDINTGLVKLDKTSPYYINDGNVEKVLFEVNPACLTAASYEVPGKIRLAGAGFALSMYGNPLTPNVDYAPAGPTGTNDLKVVIADDILQRLTKPQDLTWTWTTAPDGYTFYNPATTDFPVDTPTTLEVSDWHQTIEMKLRKIVIVQLKLKKYVFVEGSKEEKNPVKDKSTYSVMLYKDTQCTQPALTSPVDLTVNKSNYVSAEVTIPDIGIDKPEGHTYYLKETAAAAATKETKYNAGDGVWNGTNPFPIKVSSDGTTLSNGAFRKDISVSIGNYEELHQNSSGFKLRLEVYDSKHQKLNSNLKVTFVVSNSAKNALGKNPVFHLKDAYSTEMPATGTYSLPFPITDKSATVYMRPLSVIDTTTGNDVSAEYVLVNKSFSQLATIPSMIGGNGSSGKKYPVLTQYADQKNSGTGVFRMMKISTETKDVAELSLTKSVTYKKTPIRVNATYYIGIFQDKALTKKMFVKAMTLQNASSLTSKLNINLYKLSNADHSITLYFAETDKNGKPVQGGKKTGYNISLSAASVTLSPQNPTASVVCTNDILQGSNAEKNLNNPTSGFAGDASVLAQAQEIANSTASETKKTGDSTPFETTAWVTLISAAGVILLAALVIRRKRRGGQN